MDQDINGETLYRIAQDAYYNKKKLDVAYTLYHKITELHLNTEEATYSYTQIGNIQSSNPTMEPLDIDLESLIQLAQTVQETRGQEVDDQGHIVKANDRKQKNKVGKMVEIVSILELIASAIVGILLSLQFSPWGLEGFSIITFVTWIVIGTVAWIMLRAFAEIIYLLDDIRTRGLEVITKPSNHESELDKR